MNEIDPCTWAHAVNIDYDKLIPCSRTYGAALMSLALGDEPRDEHADFWDRLENNLSDPDYRAEYERDKAQILGG